MKCAFEKVLTYLDFFGTLTYNLLIDNSQIIADKVKFQLNIYSKGTFFPI